MSATVYILECITVEIFVKNSQKVLSCVYRTPGTCIDLFNTTLVELLGKVNSKNPRFVCGDFNINLMNADKLEKNRDFVDSMYSLGLIPTILKPSRITTTSATLIDNIFTNIMDSKITSGL